MCSKILCQTKGIVTFVWLICFIYIPENTLDGSVQFTCFPFRVVFDIFAFKIKLYLAIKLMHASMFKDPCAKEQKLFPHQFIVCHICHYSPPKIKLGMFIFTVICMVCLKLGMFTFTVICMWRVYTWNILAPKILERKSTCTECLNFRTEILQQIDHGLQGQV